MDALEWVAAYNVSHADGIDVVNMSLGAPFGSNTDPDAIATNNLVDTGVVVVASAGNESAVPYITGAPAAATKAISVAALDAFPTIPMATVDLPGASDISGNNQNAYPALPVTGVLHVVAGTHDGLSLGCTAGRLRRGLGRQDRRDPARRLRLRGQGRRGAGGRRDRHHRRQPRPTPTVGALPTFIGYNPELFTIPMIGTAKEAVTRRSWRTTAPR